MLNLKVLGRTLMVEEFMDGQWIKSFDTFPSFQALSQDYLQMGFKVCILGEEPSGLILPKNSVALRITDAEGFRYYRVCIKARGGLAVKGRRMVREEVRWGSLSKAIANYEF